MSAFKTWLNSLTSKTTPADADELYLRDSVTGNSRKLTWVNLKTGATSGIPGAAGDGVTVDSAAILAAVTAAGVGGKITFQPGKTYSITGWASVTLFDSATATDTDSFTVTATGLDTANDGVIFQVVACNGVNSLYPYVQDANYTISTHGSICGRVWPSSAATGTSVTHTASGNTAKSICLAAFS